MTTLTRLLALAALLVSSAAPAPSQEKDGARTAVRPLAEALVGPALPLPPPAFAAAEDDGEGPDLLARLPAVPKGRDLPRAGDWRLIDAAGLQDLGRAAIGRPEGHRLVVALDAARHVALEVRIATQGAVRVALDGASVGRRARPTAADGAGKDRPEPFSAKLALEPGPHLLIIDVAFSGDVDARPGLEATLAGDPAALEAVTTRVRGPRRLTADDLLDGVDVGDVALSADGRFVSLRLQDPAAPTKERRSWIEIRAVEDGRAVTTLEDAQAFRWLEGAEFGFLRGAGEKKKRLWLGSPERAPQPLGEPIERLEDWRALGEGRGHLLVTAVEEKKDDEAKKGGMRRFRGLFDRGATFRKTVTLHRVDADGGGLRPVAGGDLPIAIQDVRPDGAAVLVRRPLRDLEQRPFEGSELVEIDLATLAVTRLAAPLWLRAARYADRGERVLVAAGPSAFGPVGRAPGLAEDAIPNEYDRQLYLLERDGAVRSLTLDFDPAIDDVIWNEAGRSVWALTIEGEERSVHRLRLDDDAGWQKVADRVDAVSSLGVAEGRPDRIVIAGSSPGAAESVRVLDVPAKIEPGASDEDGEILRIEPRGEAMAPVALGDVRRFDVILDDGTVVPGRIHFPPDYDANRNWPAIVYYYGGTMPTDRGFGGRYPKNLWAAHGYVVYVLTPSGAIGFGQEHAARHVNDWGKRTSDEIVACTEAFLDAHPAVDPTRVGCIGASYGGFMTMLLLTRTQIFATGISHAGISSISSYWGEGAWGWIYNAVAGADSYPWNAPDLYVQQSALFAADRIEASLLLLHGADDTNVPKGESDQMYTALKILGKRVEYLQFEGEDHWILDYDRRKLWMRCIVAWFDRELKHEPAWWDALVKDR